MSDEHYELRICVDCAIWHANGDSSGMTDERLQEVQAGRGIEGMHIAVGDDDGFSMSRCDACLSPLGGDRFTATAWKIDDAEGDEDDDTPTNPYAGPGGLLDEFRQAEREIGTY